MTAPDALPEVHEIEFARETRELPLVTQTEIGAAKVLAAKADGPLAEDAAKPIADTFIKSRRVESMRRVLAARM